MSIVGDPHFWNLWDQMSDTSMPELTYTSHGPEGGTSHCHVDIKDVVRHDRLVMGRPPHPRPMLSTRPQSCLPGAMQARSSAKERGLSLYMCMRPGWGGGDSSVEMPGCVCLGSENVPIMKDALGKKNIATMKGSSGHFIPI